MSAYELQVFQNGGWQFDSYFDSRDLVISEAERLDSAGRYLGVRVLEEIFNEEKQSSSYRTVFSRLKKNDEIGGKKVSAAGLGVELAAEKGRSSRAPSKSKRKHGSFLWQILGGVLLVVLGIAMIYFLREFSGSY